MKPNQAAPKPDPDAVPLYLRAGNDPATVLAQSFLEPTVTAACIVRAFNKNYRDKDGPTDGPAIGALTTELDKQANFARRGDLRRAEGMLLSQAHALDAIFGKLARRAALNEEEHMGACELFLRLALKAQSQCRATLETLAAIKNPPIVFARQANIAAGPQQVNNGIAVGEGSRARETENPQSKLLETQHGKRMDSTATGASSGADPHLATLGEIHRPANLAGKGALVEECLQGQHAPGIAGPGAGNARAAARPRTNRASARLRRQSTDDSFKRKARCSPRTT